MILKCRSCDSDNLSSIIPLGKLPLANALLEHKTKEFEANYNLEVMLCQACGLAQLKDLIDPAELFSDYVYFSSNSDAMLASAKKLVDRIIPTLPDDAFVIEVASNDGYLLKNYVNAGINVLGVDPASNIASFANEHGVPTLCDFFSENLAIELAQSGKKADIIHANNVMAHVPNINSFIKGLKILLKENGKAVIEVPYFLELVKKIEFDTIYHEHVYYFSVSALQKAFERHGLEISDIEKLSLHGGSLRLFVTHAGQGDANSVVQTMIQEEDRFGLHKSETYILFMQRLAGLKQDVINVLSQLKSEGAKIAAYGASAKGTTLLNYFGIGADCIDFVVDRSFAKQGKFTPGTQLEILPPSKLIEENVTHALLLTWNFADEIMAQQHEFIERGGKFILPLPYVKIAPQEDVTVKNIVQPDEGKFSKEGARVLIGMPVYNEEECLPFSVGCLLKQSYANLKIVIFDNCSTDNTLKVIESFNDSRITVIKNSENEGPWNNYIRMVNHVEGRDDYDYFLWGDVDDYYHPDYLKRLIELFEVNPKAVLAMPSVAIKYVTTDNSVRTTDSVRNVDVMTFPLLKCKNSKFRKALQIINDEPLQYSLAIRSFIRKRAFHYLFAKYRLYFSVEEYTAVLSLYLGGIVTTDVLLHEKYQSLYPLALRSPGIEDIFVINTVKKKLAIFYDDINHLYTVKEIGFFNKAAITYVLFHRMFLRNKYIHFLDRIGASDNVIIIKLLALYRFIKRKVKKI